MGFKKNLSAFLLIGIIGTLSHFVYKWTGENFFVGLFFPVNESIWEHLKLIFFPSALYFGLEYFLSKNKKPNHLPAAVKGIFCGMLAVIVLFYTVTGIIGRVIDFINIIIYFIAVIITISKRNYVIENGKEYSKNQLLLIYGAFILTALLFMIWSYNPPSCGIFIPPV